MIPCRMLTNRPMCNDPFTAALAEIGETPPPEETQEIQENKYRQMFKLKSLHLMAVFVLIYVGVEVTLGGQSAENLAFRSCDSPFDLRRLDCYIRYRPSWWRPVFRIHLFWFLWRYAYVFPNFGIRLTCFVGLTLGRIGLLWVTQKVRSMIYCSVVIYHPHLLHLGR